MGRGNLLRRFFISVKKQNTFLNIPIKFATCLLYHLSKSETRGIILYIPHPFIFCIKIDFIDDINQPVF